MFLTSHAKREHPRVEARLEDADAREGLSYGARLFFEGRSTGVIEFAYDQVALHRGELAWCQALADRVRREAREILNAPAH